MAGPMRDNSLDNSHRTKVADPRAATAAKAETNFEYDDNEWDIGIGDLIIDLDADIEKTNEKTSSGGAASMASAGQAGGAKGKLAIEHSATVDKGLKMKIKRTKPGGKTSEAKHEIVKSGEQQNGNGEKHMSASAGVKRGSSGHRRDKTREKHEVNGVVRPPVQRVVFPVTVPAPGAPSTPGPQPSEPPPVPSPAPPPVTPPAPQPSATLPPPPTLEPEAKLVPVSPTPVPPSSPPPPKKLKPSCGNPSDISKEVVDVCVGTSVGTITEPDCLGPCEPGTSVTLEGIVWHETEGVLVVNVTWRGKTYVGTLLDCTRHDWAPPRFCDSPTSDLDARTPKGRGKRGRQATGTSTSNDLSNFTETRSSVHSKLRSNNNGGAKGRRNPGGPASPTPFVPPKPDTTPGKRKPKAPEEEAPAKKSKPPPPTPTPTPTPTPPIPPIPTPPSSSSASSSSPPPSPVLLECPEPNCSKKYKHINGLKYHQSHAHGNADDEETKESAGSLSEAEEAPSPAPVIKKEAEPSPAEVSTPETPTPPIPMEVPIPSPQQRPSTPTPTPEVETPPTPLTPEKSVIKPGVLRFGTQEEALLTIPSVPSATRPVQNNTVLQPLSPRQPSPSPNPQVPIQLVIQPQTQPVTPHVVQIAQTLSQQNPAINAKVPQFKVKPTSVLMPDDKKVVKPPNHKKKNRKSPAGSPHPHPHLLEPQPLGLEPGGREDVQSPAYSDISDDGAPVLDPEVDASKSKPRTGDKKVEVNSGTSPHSMQHYNMYPYYGQPPYLVPSVTTESKPKDNTNDKSLEAKPGLEKEKKDGANGGGDFQQKMLPQHYYPYGYVPGYPYNLEPGYSVPMVAEEKATVIKEEKSPGPIENIKQNLPPAPTTLHVPNPSKIKTEPGTKEKHPNENHQILKESIEMKNQMSPAYLYSRSQQQQSQGIQQQDDMRRYYIYPERRKEHSGQSENPSGLKATPPPQQKHQASVPVPSPKHKDKVSIDEKKEEKVKQEGVKPTMETQGPPPPPTSSYAYFPSGYMQSPHYGAIPFDPNHPVYARGINPMIVPSPYPNNPYMHPQLHPPMPRYHAPEDLSRPPPPGGPKALDLLQHHAQYYTSHKIHELQERALKSPTPKATVASASPSAERQNVGTISGPQGTPTSTSASQRENASTATGKTVPSDGKDSRSPPPQRHVHTHHHTHVGLGYPILTGQYPAPYGGKPL